MKQFKGSPLDRVMAKIEPVTESGCWIFMGALNDAGYGIVGKGKRGAGNDRSHRIVWQHHNGNIPKGMFICHKCDVPSCCNPNHLFLGTPKDNHHDMQKKKRDVKPPKNYHDVGEYRYNAKLTESDVLLMRKMHEEGLNAYKISKLTGKVSSATVYKILKRLSWKHVA